MDSRKIGRFVAAAGMTAALFSPGASFAQQADPASAARQRAIEAQVMDSLYDGTEESERSGAQINHARRMMWRQRLFEIIGRDRAMRNIPRPPEPGAMPQGAPPEPGATPPGAPPEHGATPQGAPPEHGAMPQGAPPRGAMAGAAKRPKKPANQSFAIHVDNDGYDSTGVWREGLFYTNRNITGRRDRFMASYMHTQGIDSVSTGYSIEFAPQTSLDVDFITNAMESTGGDTRARQIHGHAYSVGLNLHRTLVKTRDMRIEAGVAFAHTRLASDMGNRPGPLIGTRGRTLDTISNRTAPYAEFFHYGDSSMVYHRHCVSNGGFNTIRGAHSGFTAYNLDFMYEKSYAHGQKITARAAAQASDRGGLSSADRFYIGGSGSVRGYKENFISGDSGFAAGIEYRVPAEPSRRLSAFAFFDCGRVGGKSAPAHAQMTGTGIGLAYDFDDVHATLSLGFPLKREVGSPTDRDASKTRIHFMIHMGF